MKSLHKNGIIDKKRISRKENGMYILLFVIGLAFDALCHLIIPIFFAKRGKPYSNKILFLIALGGGLLGFAVHMLMDVGFTVISAAVLSSFWTLIGYVILYLNCSKKRQEKRKKTQEATQEQKKD